MQHYYLLRSGGNLGCGIEFIYNTICVAELRELRLLRSRRNCLAEGLFASLFVLRGGID